MSETIKVGDVVAWDKVPDGALVRHGCPCYERHGENGCTVGQIRVDGKFECFARPWFAAYSWSSAGDDESVTIVALGLTGQESAADLRRMAEVFEVREALFVAESRGWLCVVIGAGTAAPMILAEGDDLGTVAERLHAAGWRPGMTADDAARLLAAKEST